MKPPILRIVLSALLFGALALGATVLMQQPGSGPPAGNSGAANNVAVAARPIAAADDRDRILLGLARESVATNSSALYNIRIENGYAAIWRQYGTGNVAPVVLEIGPGTSIAQGVAFAMRGAQKYYGLDIYRDPKFYDAPGYESVAFLLDAVAPGTVRRKAADVFRVEDGKVRFNPERMEFLYPHHSHDIPLAAGSVDYAFSNAVFEHIADPEATIRALWRVLKPGGVTAHQIDMRDHRDFSKPFEFLKLDAIDWKKLSADIPAHMYMNRWRLAEFRAAFERHGFEILAMDINLRIPVSEELRGALAPEFRKRSLEDLSAVGAMVVARRR